MLKIAVVGATGAVGRRMVEDLAATDLKIDLSLFASPRSAGQKIPFRKNDIEVQAYALEKLAGIPYVLMSAGGEFSKAHSPAIAKQGAAVIDNSSAWRMDPEIPLVVPEVNPHVLKNFKTGIIANPNCSTIQLVVSLKPLQDAFRIRSLHVATYQSVSGSGQKGIEELTTQLSHFSPDKTASSKFYPRPIITNIIPAIDILSADGHCKEEEKVVRETRKIMDLPDLDVFATTTRVPTLYCHCEAVSVELKTPVTREQVLKTWEKADGVRLFAENDYLQFPDPLIMRGKAEVAVTRVRLPLGKTQSNWVQFWNVADNLKKGAATNAVQILNSLL